MSRFKTGNEKEYRRLQKRKEKRIRKGNPYISTEIDPIDTSTLTPKSRAIVESNMEISWITRNSRCPCDSNKRFKNCCMEVENG